MNKIELTISTPSGIAIKEEVDSVVLPASNGDIEVFNGHTSLITKIKFGFVVAFDGKNKERFICHEGVAKISGTAVNLITHFLEKKENIDLERAKKSKERAEERLKSNDSSIDIKRAEYSLKRALIRIDLLENNL